MDTRYDGKGLPLEVVRRTAPDRAGLHALSATYEYDAAGRKTAEGGGLGEQRFGYDLRAT